MLISRTPCGFAFVEYYLHSEAVACLRYVSGTKLDERIIRCDLDPGYQEGRQFGRGKSGGQVRDEFRQEYDSGRGESSSPTKLLKTNTPRRRMGSSAFGRGEKERRARQAPFTNAVRHLRLVLRWTGYGWSRCAKGRGHGETETGQVRGRRHRASRRRRRQEVQGRR